MIFFYKIWLIIVDIILLVGNYKIDFSRFAEGFIFNGEKFVLIKADDEVIQGKSKGEAKLPLTIQKCNTCVVVMLGKAGSNGGSVSVAVNKMAQYLKENNY